VGAASDRLDLVAGRHAKGDGAPFNVHDFGGRGHL